jgi:hypothetical protein
MNSKEPKTFAFTGTPALLEAMSKELINVGYKKPHNKFDEYVKYLSLGNYTKPQCFESKDYFLSTYVGCIDYKILSTQFDVIFNLPSQYQEGLDFAKAQFNHEYWNPKPKFEVGKWYKFNNCWYAKIVESWYCKESIDINGKYTNSKTSTFIESQSYKLLTDLSPIQQYLPDGHEDKLIKYTLEVDEYYKVEDKSGFWMIGKVSKGGSDESTFDKEYYSINLRGNCYYTIDSTDNFRKDYWCYYSEEKGKVTRNFTKLSKDSDEVKWLEACNKAGKYLTKEEALTPKHKLAECIKGEVYWSNNSTYPTGHIWRAKTLRSTEFMDTLSCLSYNLTTFGKDSGINHMHWENLRKATSDEITWLEVCEKANEFIPKDEALKPVATIKAGDSVIVTKQHLSNSAEVGMLCTVIKIDSKSNSKYHVPYLVKDYYQVNNWNIDVKETWCEDVRLATPEEIDSILFEFAKKKYPIGTVVYPTHLTQPTNEKAVVTTHDRIKDFNHIGFEKTYESDWIPCVYDKSCNRWAGIVSTVGTPISYSNSGYEAKFNKSEKTVKFGCKTVTLDELKAIRTVINLNKQFDEGFKIYDDEICSDSNEFEDVSLESINKLITALESK